MKKQELPRLDIKIIHMQTQTDEWENELVFVWEVSWTEKGRWAKEFENFEDAVVFAKRLGAK